MMTDRVALADACERGARIAEGYATPCGESLAVLLGEAARVLRADRETLARALAAFDGDDRAELDGFWYRQADFVLARLAPRSTPNNVLGVLGESGTATPDADAPRVADRLGAVESSPASGDTVLGPPPPAAPLDPTTPPHVGNSASQSNATRQPSDEEVARERADLRRWLAAWRRALNPGGDRG